MIVVLTITYVVLVWLVYFRMRLLPFNLTNKIGVALVGCVGILGLVLATNYSHPHSSDVRVIRYVIPISTYLPKPAQVVEVPVRPNTPVKKGEVLFRVDARPYEYEVHRLEAALVAASTDLPKLQAELKVAQAAVVTAETSLKDAKEDFDRQEKLKGTGATSEADYLNVKTRFDNATSARREAAAQRDRAQLAVESKIGGEFTSVAQVRQQLAAARLNLEQTTVTAPDDGFVTDLAVRPGLMVAPATPAMAFVSTAQKGVVVATYSQHPLRNIQPGERAELVFAMYPGRVFKGEVETVIEMTGQGQAAPTGDLPEVVQPEKRGRFAVRLKLADDDLARLPGGAGGSAVVYTQTLRPLGVIQKMAIRMEGYLNYLTGF
jgi:multidrug resistance efflux pump